MRPFRSSGVPALLLALLTGGAALLPEAGHSLAHRVAPRSHDYDEHSHELETRAAVTDGHAADNHAHLSLLVTAPGKLPLPHVVLARVADELLDPIGRVLRVSPLVAHGLAPPEQAQAPPPPSRAPPLA